MSFKKILSMFEYSAWFIKQYSEQQVQHNIYRIADVKQFSSGQYKLTVQIIGKSTVIECTPQEIVANDQMLEGFSKKDVRAITYYACEQIKNPTYKIAEQEFSVDSNKMLFKLKKCDSDEVLFKTAGQIALNLDIMNGLDSDDIKTIIYLAGYEHSVNEKRDMGSY